MEKAVLSIIDMEEYYKMASQIVDEIFDCECKRSIDLAKSREAAGKETNAAALLDSTKIAILQITIAVCSKIEREVLKRMQQKDARLFSHKTDEYFKR